MKVIFFQDYKKTGKRGEVANVKDGFARNYLIPQKIAVPYSTGNLKRFNMEKASIEKRERKLIENEEQLVGKLDGVEITFKAKVHDENILYGSISEKQIVEELEKSGFKIDKDHVMLDEHIKTTGNFPVIVKLKFGKEAQIKVHVLNEDESGQRKEEEKREEESS
ncbi:50S ribosomal protein L9 [bacterium]|nr:50S ribosomal protein L9 [bacterium]